MSRDILELHVIERENDCIVLHPPSYTLFKAGKTAGKILDLYSKGEPEDEISAAQKVAPGEVRNAIERVREFLVPQPTVALADASSPDLSRLDKLELLVSNDCNLNCVYCYAQGGDYGRSAGLMAPEVATAAVERMLEHYSTLGSIVFFGGEPLMNLPAIEAVCELLASKLAAAEMRQMPALGVITNGTLITERAAELIQRFNISVTVSVDGPKRINDKLRPFRSGAGTYESIKRGINKLRDRRISPHFEFTYTQAHVDSGITPADALDHLRDELGFAEGYGSIGDADLADGDPLNLINPVRDFYRPLLDWSADKFTEGQLVTGDITLATMLQIIFKQARSYICPAGCKALAVTPTGDIFPCHILVDRDAFAIGNIRDPQWYDSTSAENIFRTLQYAQKEENPFCGKCWARYICVGCLGGWKPTGSERVFIAKTRCELKRQIWEMMILKIMGLKDDEAKWAKLELNLKKILEHRHRSALTDINTAAGLVQIQTRPGSGAWEQQPEAVAQH